MRGAIWSASRRLASLPVGWAIYRMPVPARRRALFTLSNARLPHFSNPKSFNDKINWRILNDRRPLLEWTCDKIAMKERASHVPDLQIAKILWAGTDLRTLASAELPKHWVLKPNHRSGLVYFGAGKPEIAQLEQRTAGWLRTSDYDKLGEWAYSRARPLLLAEELIGTPGLPPTDYKFFVFDGEVAAIQVDVDRHSSHQRRIYLPDWSPLEVRSAGHALPPVQPEPERLHRMLAIARELGSEFDFIRIDLYNVSGSIFFGEFTPYAGSGFDRFVPASFDLDLGRRWRLPDLAAARLER
jgi:TupA-like ATPgrasp